MMNAGATVALRDALCYAAHRHPREAGAPVSGHHDQVESVSRRSPSDKFSRAGHARQRIGDINFHDDGGQNAGMGIAIRL